MCVCVYTYTCVYMCEGTRRSLEEGVDTFKFLTGERKACNGKDWHQKEKEKKNHGDNKDNPGRGGNF